MSFTRADKILPKAQAAVLAAEIGAEVRDLLAKAKANPEQTTVPWSDAKHLAAIGQFFTGYVTMFETRSP